MVASTQRLRIAARCPHILAVIPVGEARNRAIADGIAPRNPYPGVADGRINLWAADGYHASAAGSCLEALAIFGRVTGRDRRRLGRNEEAAAALGISPDQRLPCSVLPEKHSRPK